MVDYVSSHLEGALSEKIVAGDHSSQETPEVTRELRRILLDHLDAGPALAKATARPHDANVGRAGGRQTP